MCDDLLEDHVMFKVSTRLNFDLNEDTDKRERQQSCSFKKRLHKLLKISSSGMGSVQCVKRRLEKLNKLV